MRNTLIVNLFAGPGCGKSTCAAWLFAQLKMMGIDCEYVSEFAKDKVWEKNDEVFKCEFYISGKQSFKISRCFGKVDVIITDSPIGIGAQYCESQKLKEAILEEFNRYGDNNINVLLNRIHQYNPNGRNQNEEEAKEIDKNIKDWLETNNINFYIEDASLIGYQNILNFIIKRIKNEKV